MLTCDIGIFFCIYICLIFSKLFYFLELYHVSLISCCNHYHGCPCILFALCPRTFVVIINSLVIDSCSFNITHAKDLVLFQIFFLIIFPNKTCCFGRQNKLLYNVVWGDNYLFLTIVHNNGVVDVFVRTDFTGKLLCHIFQKYMRIEGRDS